MTFLSRNWRGLLVLILGLVTILAAQFLLQVCTDAGHMLETTKGTMVPMRCHWSEQALKGVGGLVAGIGVVMLLARAEAQRALSAVAALAGLLMILQPLWLLPTCMMPSMICNLSFKPGAILLGALVVIAGVLGMIQWKRVEQSV